MPDSLIKIVRRVALELMVSADEQEQKSKPPPEKKKKKKIKRRGNVIEVDFRRKARTVD